MEGRALRVDLVKFGSKGFMKAVSRRNSAVWLFFKDVGHIKHIADDIEHGTFYIRGNNMVSNNKCMAVTFKNAYLPLMASLYKIKEACLACFVENIDGKFILVDIRNGLSDIDFSDGSGYFDYAFVSEAGHEIYVYNVGGHDAISVIEKIIRVLGMALSIIPIIQKIIFKKK